MRIERAGNTVPEVYDGNRLVNKVISLPGIERRDLPEAVLVVSFDDAREASFELRYLDGPNIGSVIMEVPQEVLGCARFVGPQASRELNNGWKLAQLTSSGTLPLDVEPGWRTISPWLSPVDNVRGFSLINRAFHRQYTAWGDRASIATLRAGALASIDSRRRAALEASSKDFCAVCHEGGEVTMCDECDRVFHNRCVVRPSASARMLDAGGSDDEWLCPHCCGEAIVAARRARGAPRE